MERMSGRDATGSLAQLTLSELTCVPGCVG